MNDETIDVTIHQDGRVEIRVQGIKGSHCTTLTAEAEALLGGAGERILSEEYYECTQDTLSRQRLET